MTYLRAHFGAPLPWNHRADWSACLHQITIAPSDGDPHVVDARVQRDVADGPLRIVVLISGGGSNLQALLAACNGPDYPVEIVAVGSDRASAGGLELAAAQGIPTFVESVKDYYDRASWDRALTDRCLQFSPDLVVSAGFLKLVGPQFLAALPGRYVNTHNSLLPAFAGIHGPADALAYGVKVAGATLFVVDDGVDTGPIIAQVAVPVAPDDDVASLTERIKVAERAQLVEAIGAMGRHGWTITGRVVSIP